MTEQEQLAELLAFFKALADANRLKIVGLLAQQPTSVEKLADTLGLSVSTTSHHLSTLSKVGLVSARAEGHYYIYSLQTETLKTLSRTLLQEENLPKLSEGLTEDTFERKVLSSFLDEEGRIKAFPVQDKKFVVLLRHVLKSLEAEKRYSEAEINEIFKQFSEDTATLRRGMIEFKLMEREGGGGAYWIA